MSPPFELPRHRRTILDAAARHGVANVRLIPPLTTTDARVHLLVDATSASLLDLASLELELEAATGARINVVAEGGLRPSLREGVLQGAEAV